MPPPKKTAAQKAATVRARQACLETNHAKESTDHAADPEQKETNTSTSNVEEDDDEDRPARAYSLLCGPLSPLPGEGPGQLLIRRMRVGKAMRSAADGSPPAAKKRKITVTDLGGESSDSEGAPQPADPSESDAGIRNMKEVNTTNKEQANMDDTLRQRSEEIENTERDGKEESETVVLEDGEVGVAAESDLPEPSGMTNAQKRVEVKRLFGLIVDILLPE